jgi:hypothetical protein
MVVYGLALGNQRQLNGGDFGTRTYVLWPTAELSGYSRLAITDR